LSTAHINSEHSEEYDSEAARGATTHQTQDIVKYFNQDQEENKEVEETSDIVNESSSDLMHLDDPNKQGEHLIA